jgi:Xaa-Pro aminopeptidase
MILKNLKEYIIKKNIDLTLIFNLDDKISDGFFTYLTNTKIIGFIIIKKKGKDLLFVPSLEYEKALKFIKNFKIIKIDKPINIILKKYIKENMKIGIDYSKISLDMYNNLKRKKIKFHNISNISKQLRMIKNKDELKQIKKACFISDEIFSSIIFSFKNFKTESDIVSFISSETYKKGCTLSFGPIIASGKNSSIPHHIPTTKKLQKGFLVMDFGVKYNNYCSDITRTIYIGNPTKKEKEIYNKILKCQLKILSIIKPNESTKIIDKISRDLIGDYPHSLGHGLGIDVHELPNLNQKNDYKIKKGMVLAIEPGHYIPKKYGIRIEDDIYITDKGCEILTKSTKALICIKK